MVLGLGNSITSAFTPSEAAVYTATTSWNFDGSDDYINLGNSWALKGRVTDTSESVGISAAVWFLLDDIQSTGTLHNIMNCIQYPGGWLLQYNNTRLVAGVNIGDSSRTAHKSISSGWRTLGTDASPLRASGWHHFGLTWDGRYLKMYLNGSQYGSTVDHGSDDNYIYHNEGGAGGATQPTCMSVGDVDLLIGADPGNLTNSGGCGVPGTSTATGNFEGMINEAAVWNKILDEDAFSKIFEAVNTDGAVLDLSKDDGDYDYSGDLVALYRATDGISSTTAINLVSPGTHDGSMKNSLGTHSGSGTSVPS